MSDVSDTFTFSTYIDPKNHEEKPLQNKVTLLRDIFRDKEEVVYKISEQDESEKIEVGDDCVMQVLNISPTTSLDISFSPKPLDTFFVFPSIELPYVIQYHYITKNALETLVAQVKEYSFDISKCPTPSRIPAHIREIYFPNLKVATGILLLNHFRRSKKSVGKTSGIVVAVLVGLAGLWYAYQNQTNVVVIDENGADGTQVDIYRGRRLGGQDTRGVGGG